MIQQDNIILYVALIVLLIGWLTSYFSKSAVYRRRLTKQITLMLYEYQLIKLCLVYINRGTITKEEYDVLINEFYTPFSEFESNEWNTEYVNKLVLQVQNLLYKSEPE